MCGMAFDHLRGANTEGVSCVLCECTALPWQALAATHMCPTYMFCDRDNFQHVAVIGCCALPICSAIVTTLTCCCDWGVCDPNVRFGLFSAEPFWLDF